MQRISRDGHRGAPGRLLGAIVAEQCRDSAPAGGPNGGAARDASAPQGRRGLERSPGHRVRVLIVEDRKLLAEAVGAVLRVDPELELVGIETELARALARIRQAGADIVVIDYTSLTRLAGARLSGELRAACPGVKLVVLTPSEDESTLLSCVRAGAAAQVSQSSPPAALLESIKRVHAGEVLFAPELLVKLLDWGGGAVEPPEQQAIRPLAPRERAVLQCLANGLSTEEVAAVLGITPHTVRSHLKHAMAKLQVRSKLEAVIQAIRLGIIELP